MTPLHEMGQGVRELFLQIPLPVVRLLFVALPAVLLWWVWRLPLEEVTPTQSSGRWTENLKFGAALALILQIVIYTLL